MKNPSQIINFHLILYKITSTTKLLFPSANLKPTLSGNYLLIVFLENQKDQPILSQRMMIIDEKVSVIGKCQTSHRFRTT